MWTWMKQLLTSPVFEDEEKTRQATLLRAVLLTLAFATAMIGIALLAIYGPPSGPLGWSTQILEIVVIVFSLGMLFLIPRGFVRPVGWMVCLLLWLGVSFSVYNFGGLLDVMMGGYFLIVVLAALILGGWGILIFTLLSSLSGILLFYGEVSGLLRFAERQVEPFDLIAYITILILIGLLLRYALNSLTRALDHARRNAHALDEANRKLQVSGEALQARTLELERRSHYLEATAEVAREASSVLDLEQLLRRVVAFISKRFEPYQANIFLLDPSGQWAVLRAASGEGGLRLMARDFRLKVAGPGIVAHVIRTGQPYVAPEVSRDPLYLSIEEAADMRSELTLPLRARGEILGALTVQSPEPDAFHDQDIAVLQTLADQVALAISNARLFQQVQESLEAARQAYGEVGRQAWLQIIRAQPELAICRDERGLSTVSAWLDAEVEQTLQTGQTIIGGDGATSLAVPVRVRGQVIGAIDAHKPKDAGIWTKDQIALLETLAQQLGDALEGARLYQEAQRREARERLLSQVGTRMRETLDVETVLKTAVREMGTNLGITRVEVRLGGGQAQPGNAPDLANEGKDGEPD